MTSSCILAIFILAYDRELVKVIVYFLQLFYRKKVYANVFTLFVINAKEQRKSSRSFSQNGYFKVNTIKMEERSIYS